jgi:hypothetical protein
MRIPIHLVDFHIWYLKEKEWIQRLENGQFAITATGVDQVEKGRLRLSPDRLLTAQGSNLEKDDWKANPDPVRSIPVHNEDWQ